MALRLGAHSYADDDFLIMAIVNRTPDSFYDRGSTFGEHEAMAAVDQAVAEGADIIDIGGVKAGPGEVVDTQEELSRTVGFVSRVRERHPDTIISVDTWRHEVADAACREGADLVNDAWGGYDPLVAEVASHHDVGLVCTHTGGASPRTRPHRVTYDDVLQDVLAFATSETSRALSLGVGRDRLIVDPGHDFGKNTRHSLLVTRHLDDLVDLGWPVLVSLSNKDFIGESLDQPVTDRLVGTLAATAVTAWLGARIFRVHQPAETRQVVQMVSVIRGRRPPAVSRRGLA